MSLTIGSIAPLGRPTGGALNFPLPDTPAHLIYLHRLPYRIRGEVGDTTVVDTALVDTATVDTSAVNMAAVDTATPDVAAARMLHETRLLPRWYFPEEAVRRDLLEPSSTVTHCPFKGDARYWHMRIGERLIEDAFWEYPSPLSDAIDLRGLLSPYTEKFDRWLEEDEEALGHPRDPFHRVDIRRSSARVTVRAGATVVAESTHALAVAETGLPLRWYLPRDDVRDDALAQSDASSVCAYKGVASYWSVEAGGTTYSDALWSYLAPNPEAQALAGYLSFLGEGIDVIVER